MKKIIFTALLFIAFNYSYSQPQLIRTLAQQYSSTGTWVDSAEELYYYNSVKLVEHKITNDLRGSTLRVWFIDSNKYDINKRISTTKRYGKDPATSALGIIATVNYTYAGILLDKKEEIFSNRTLVYNYTYNSNGKLIEEVFNIFKNEYTYNSAGDVETVTRKLNNNGTWKNSSRDSLVYAGGRLIESHLALWQGQTTKSWVTHLETKFSYNTDGTLQEKLEQTTNGTKTWRTLYFYKNSTTGFTKITNNEFKIYPNPTSGKFTVELEGNTLSTISITDVTGKHIFTSKVSDNLDVDISHLAKGFYFVNVRNTNGITTQKIVIQ